MVPFGGPGFMLLPNGSAVPPQGALPHYMYSFPMPVPGAHQPAIGVIAAGPGETLSSPCPCGRRRLLPSRARTHHTE